MTSTARPSRQHLELTREAGLGRLSFISVIAGVIAAYGAFAIVASIAGAILTAIDVDTEFRTNDWTGSGAVASLVTALVLLIAYLFGGYVAGRMGRRAAILHGVSVFVGSLVLAAVVSGVVALISDDDQLRSNLRSVGIPTTTDQFSGVAVTAVIVSLAAMLVGSVAGAIVGERWHTKLDRRAADPSIGREAERERERAAREASDQAREETLARQRIEDRDMVDARDRRTNADVRPAAEAPVADRPVVDESQGEERSAVVTGGTVRTEDEGSVS